VAVTIAGECADDGCFPAPALRRRDRAPEARRRA